MSRGRKLLSALEGEMACRGLDPALFIIEKGESADDAKAVCHTCPSELPCLELAIAHNLDGIHGGTSKRERKEIVKQRRAQLPQSEQRVRPSRQGRPKAQSPPGRRPNENPKAQSLDERRRLAAFDSAFSEREESWVNFSF